MYPVLFTIGNVSISTFGIFLALGLFFGAFYIWRVAQVYDVDAERTIDLILLTFFGGMVFARLFFVGTHYWLFDNPVKVLLISRYPGISFWGGLLGGLLTLWYFSRRFKMRFWETSDMAAAGLFIGLFFGSIGCFLGGCQPGLPSSLPFAVRMEGLRDPRFPLQIIEALLYLVGFYYLWRATIRFHFAGKIATIGLIVLGVIKLATESFRADSIQAFGPVMLGHILAIIMIAAGLWYYYRQARRSFKKDLRNFGAFFSNGNYRSARLSNTRKQWYNGRVYWRYRVSKLSKRFMKSANIKSRPNAVPEHPQSGN